MAGDADEAHMCALLFFITVFMRLVFIRRRNRFQQRLRLLTIRGRRRRTEAHFLHSQRKICRRRKVAWVLERPQFWFEHMLLNQYAGSLTDLEGSLNGKLFIFAEKKTTPWSQKFSETHKNRTGVLYFRFQVRFDSFVRWADHKLLLIGGNWLLTRLSYLGRWLKFNENCIEVCRLT